MVVQVVDSQVVLETELTGLLVMAPAALNSQVVLEEMFVMDRSLALWGKVDMVEVAHMAAVVVAVDITAVVVEIWNPEVEALPLRTALSQLQSHITKVSKTVLDPFRSPI
jgi:hypothetical protein